MGCNYYVKVKKEEITCPHCGKIAKEEFEKIHIGKSSVGWRFTFKNNPDYYEHNDIESLLNWLKDKEIEDEYEKEISFGEFIRMIIVKQIFQSQNIENNGDSSKFDFLDGEFC